MELQELKTLARLTGVQDDDYLAALFPLIKDAARDYTGQTFRDDLGNDVFPSMVKMALVKWVQAFANPAGIGSQSIGGASFSYTAGESAIPSEAKTLLDQYLAATGQAEADRTFRFIAAPDRSKEDKSGGFFAGGHFIHVD